MRKSGGLTLSATSGPSRRARNIRVVTARNVGFTAMNLEPHLAHPGHNRPLPILPEFPPRDYAG